MTPAQDAFDRLMMQEALSLAHRALESEDVPVGALIVHEGRVIGRGFNQREMLHDPTAHAEMIALTAAADYLNRWRIDDCTLYVTLEPCVMCAGAMVLARLGRLVFGATDPKAGACGSLFDIPRDPRLNHRIPTDGGVLAAECSEVLKAFFRRRRSLGET